MFRNCCFETDLHFDMLLEEKINVLPYILLPLCGPEEFDTDVRVLIPNTIIVYNHIYINFFIGLGYGRNA